MTFTVVIPARYQSQRFPGKILAPLKGKPMLAHVIAQVNQSQADDIIVATDDQRIAEVAESLPCRVVMTASEHQSGTSRIAEVIIKANKSDDDIIVNVQGDEPLIAPDNIDQVAAALQRNQACRMASLYERLTKSEDIFNPNVVKVIVNQQQQAMVFSRAPIPWDKQYFPQQPELSPYPFAKHIGLYAYRVSLLKQFANWQPAPLALQESLEQLTPLYYGEPIQMAEALVSGGIGVDTTEDLAKAELILSESHFA